MALKKINYNGSSKVILRLCEMVNQLIDGGGGGGSTVTYTQTLSSGTKTGSISIDGVSTDMYAPTPPVKVSDLTNDSGFITNTVNNLTNYYLKSETYTQAEVDALISAIVTLNILVVQTLPTQDISTTTIYLVPKQTAETQDIYDEYIYVNNAWEHIGTTQIDLSNYYTKSEVNTLLADKVDKVAGKQLSTEDFTSALKTKLDGIETDAEVNVQSDWNQSDNTADDFIKNKPSIPTALSDLTDDSTHRLVTDTEKSTWNGKSDFSGSYNDLTDKPTIPDAQIQSDWNQTDNTAKDYIKNKPTIPDISNIPISGIGELNVSSSSPYPVITMNSGFNLKEGAYLSVKFNSALTVPYSEPLHMYVYVLIDGITYGMESYIGNVTIDAGKVAIIVYDGTYLEVVAVNNSGGTSYSEGDGIDISAQNVISVDTTFSEASTRTNIASGDTFATILGKIKKFFTDLKDLAFIAKDGASSTKYLRGDGTWQVFPTIPAEQIQSDWNQTTTTAKDYIKNKPTIPAAQVNSDWNASSGVAKILNKPTIPSNTSQLTNDSNFITATGANLITMINALNIGNSDCEDDDYFVSQYAGGNRVGNTNYYRRSITCLYNNFRLRDGLLKRGSWLADTETYNANDIIGNIVFGYGNVSNHTNFATTGTLVDFCCRGSRGENYRFQLQCSYTNNHLYIRRRNGDANAWSSWSRLALAEEIPTVVSQANANALINSLSTGSSTPVDNDYYVSQYVGGGTTTTTYHRRPMSALYNYILGKANTSAVASTLVKRDNTGSSGFTNIFASSSSNWLGILASATACKNYANTAYAPIYASSYPGTSARRFKENIKALTEEEAEKILDVEVVSFDYKADMGISTEEERHGKRGVIAEQVEPIIPSVVTYREEEDGETRIYGVDYSKFVPYLIKMVQMQQEEINNLKAEISALKMN